MADKSLSPESLALARAWKRQVARLDAVRAAEAEALDKLPKGPFGSPENDRREAALDVHVDARAREVAALVSLPAPDMAALIFKMRLLVEEGVDITPDDVEICREDLERLIL